MKPVVGNQQCNQIGMSVADVETLSFGNKLPETCSEATFHFGSMFPFVYVSNEIRKPAVPLLISDVCCMSEELIERCFPSLLMSHILNCACARNALRRAM
jgi:hypothetical protein